MSASQVPKSKWGSLLSGAVAGLESRLDNILAEEGSAAAKNAEFERRRDEAKKAKALRAGSSQASLTSTFPQKQVEGGHEQPALTEATTDSSSQDKQPEKSPDEQALDFSADAEPSKGTVRSLPTSLDTSQQSQIPATHSLEPANTPAKCQTLPVSAKVSDLSRLTADSDKMPYSAGLENPQAELANGDSESASENEVQGYLERIDALQAKIQYLANDAAVVARHSIANSGDGSWQKKIAAKDEQIALLLEEGTKLSKAEVTQASTIRRLKMKASEDSKAQAEARRVLVEAERSYAGIQDRLVRLEDEKREAQSKLARLSRLEKELGDARRERGIKDATIHDLQSQLQATRKQADENARSGIEKSLEQEKQQSQLLQNELSRAKSEQRSRDDDAMSRVREAQNELQREKERHKGVELSYRNEISSLETRIELVRERSEEASSGATSDSHAKLLRQIETLQSQYAVASENWQILESSLQARLTILEGEKDEACRGEAEARKKARDNGIASRRLQEQVDDVKQKYQTLEHELQGQRNIAEKQMARANDAEKLLTDEQERFQAERNLWDATLQSKLDEEKAKWQSGPSRLGAEAHAMLASPRELGQRKTSYMEISGLVSRRQSSRQVSEVNLVGTERPTSRRASTFMSKASATSPNGIELERSLPGYEFTQRTGASSTHTIDADEHENSSSPYRPVNDMLSGATTSAGPSVQLVERMSAAVRRLETEKAASRDELARLSSQRDEARKEVVDLMREVEQKRALQAKVDTLDKSLAEISQRYTTTLEMLGERSERVQELEADVADIKKIYRELVESTLR